MKNEKRFLLATDKDNWANHFGVIGGLLGLVLLILAKHIYTNNLAEEKLFVIGFCIVYFVILFSFVQDEIWFASEFTIMVNGITYGGKLMRKRFVPWTSITSISLSELAIARSAHPTLICCSLNGNTPPRKKLHGMTYYRLNRKKIFVIKYSEDRFKTILSKTIR